MLVATLCLDAQHGFPLHCGSFLVEGMMFARHCASFGNRPHLSAWGRYGRASGGRCKSGDLWRCQTLRSPVSSSTRGGVSQIPKPFITCPQLFCVKCAILLHCFQKLTFIFVACAALWTVHFHLAWPAQRCGRVMLHLFCESHSQ